MTKPLPHSSECERAVLAGCLLSPSAILPRIHGRLAVHHLYEERHRHILRALYGLWSEEIEIDLLTLKARLESDGTFDGIGLAYLAGMDLDLPDLGRVDRYVTIILERAYLRHVIAGSSDLVRRCLACSVDATGVASALRALSDDLGNAVAGELPTMASVLDATYEQLEAMEAGPPGLQWGYPRLDALTRGLHPGQLVVLGGRPGMGKSAFAQALVQAALSEGRRVLWVSLEMSKLELVARLTASRTQLPLDGILGARMSVPQWSTLQQQFRAMRELPLYLEDQPLSIAEIEWLATQVAARGGLDLLVIDYLQLLGESHPTRAEELARITRRIKRLGRRLGSVVLLLSQLNRELTRRSSPEPVLADLRDSGAIEADADLVVMLHRPEYYDPDDVKLSGLAKVFVRKHRNGPLGEVALRYEGRTVTFLPMTEEAL